MLAAAVTTTNTKWHHFVIRIGGENIGVSNALVLFQVLHTCTRQMPVTDAMVFMCSVLGSFGYLVQSGPVVPQSNAWLLCTVRGAVKCPARAGGCSLRAGRKKSKHAIDQFCVSLFQFFLFCLDKEVWKRGLMAICSTNLSFEHPFNKGMLQ